jgi:YVTN family beta-propeller protein
MKTLIRFIMLLAMTASASPALAGSLDNAGSPAVGSGMPTTTDIYNRLATGAVTSITGTFKEPSAGPTAGTGKTLAEIGNILPVPDAANGAIAGEVLFGKTFWGLGAGGAWGPHTGNVAAGTNFIGDNGIKVITIPNGLYTGNKTVTATDTNLVTGNIKSGVTVFGVSGSPNVVDTTEAAVPAADANISNGKKAYVNGALVTGTLYGGYTCSGTMNGARWCDNGNGTIRDMTTGLIWLKDAGCSGQITFDNAAIWSQGLASENCGLTDGSVTGDWWAPSIMELKGLISGTEPVGLGTPRAFTNIQNYYYWSSTTYADFTSAAWYVHMGNGEVNIFPKVNVPYLLPVRGGDVRSASFIISALTLTTSESGTTATFTVRLGSQPTANVIIPVSSSDLTEGTVDKASLTFTTANWNVNQTVTVTGVSDALADGNVAYTIILGITTSTDSLYNGLDPADVAVVNFDVRSASFIISAISDNTSESGTQATFTVRLGSQPTANVIIPVSSSDLTEGTVDKASLTFTNANWNVNQTVTVTGVSDALADGNVAYTIILGTTSSSDIVYNGLDPADVAVVNNDVRSASFVISAISGNTSESGTTATFTVRLGSQPTANVTIPVSSSNLAEGTVDKASLTFTNANWSTDQTVTVTGVNDTLADGNVAYTIILGITTSTDSLYNGLDPADVAVVNSDVRSASFVISAISGNTSESGTTATFTVRLGSQPTANVTVPVSSSDLTEGTVDKASLTFTNANWNVNQTVTVTGVSDALADGNVAYTIILGATTSTDSLYNGLDPADVAVTNNDFVVQATGDFAVNVGNNTLYKLKAADGTIIWGPVNRGNCGGLAVDQVDFGVYTGGSANCTGGGPGAVYKYDASGASAWSANYAGCGPAGNYYVGNGGIAVDTTSGTPGVVLTKSGYYGDLGKVSRTNGSTIFCDATKDLGRPTIDPINGQIYAITNAGSSYNYNTLHSVTASGSLTSASSCEGYTDLNPADGMLYRGGRGCGLTLYQMNKSSLGATVWSMSLSAYVTSFDAIALQPWSGGYIYVASVSSSKIVVIDPATQTVVRTFSTAITPNNIAVNPSGGSLIISNNVSHLVYAYSPTGSLLWTSPDLGGPVNSLAAARGIVGSP